MSIEYQITSSLRLVYVEMRKALSLEELISHLEELAADENYVPPMKKIVDFTNLKDGPMPRFTAGDFAALETYYKDRLRGEHCVFVTPSDFRFGMGRLFSGYMVNANLKVSVVRTLEAALALLEINEEEFRACQRVTNHA
ncbi:MAG: hypothetical protein HY910_12520 [Desulfarculus sp.]|nr:hypothetical protein [Desulfarculus sp.]